MRKKIFLVSAVLSSALMAMEDRSWFERIGDKVVQKNFIESVKDGYVLPRNALSRIFDGEKDESSAAKDGLGVVLLDIGFDKITQRESFKYVHDLLSLEEKYAPLCSEDLRHSNESFWDCVERVSSEEDLKKLIALKEKLEDWVDTFAPPADNTCVNGFIGSAGTITCNSPDIRYLRKGWQELKQVGKLDLSMTSITSLKNLLGLTYFEEIIINNDLVSDFSGLKNVTAFKKFDLSGNRFIENLSFFNSLIQFDILALENSSIRSLSGIDNVTEFQSLDLKGSKNLTDISSLKNVSVFQDKIVLPDNTFAKKIPATSNICASPSLLSKVFINGEPIDPNKKYEILCSPIQDDGNLEPTGNCETGFAGSHYYILCADAGLAKLSSGWRKLTRVDRQFHLERNGLKAIENLDSLTYFGEFYLDKEKITSLSLPSLEAFDTLDLEGNQYLTNLDFLSGVTSLAILNMANTNIENLDGLSSLQKVVSSRFCSKGYLNFTNTQRLTDIKGLQNVTYIKDNIFLDDKNYQGKLPGTSKICALPDLLHKVALNGVSLDPDRKYETICERVGDVPPQNDCETGFNGSFGSIDCANMGLERLSSGWNSLRQISGRLYLENNKITKLDNLTGLTYAYSISFDNDKVSDFSGLSNIQSFNTISFNGNRFITDFSFFKNLTRFDTLYAENAAITSLQGLNNVTYFSRMNAKNSDLQTLNGIDNLTGFQQIDAEGTKLTDISALTKFSILDAYLIFKDTPLSNLSGLGNVTAFSYLDLKGTKITNVDRLSNAISGGTLLLENIPTLTDIGGLSKLASTIKFDNKEYQNKMSYNSPLCSTELMHGHLYVGGSIIDPRTKYDTVCEEIIDNGNIEPKNNCESGFSGEIDEILCRNMGLKRLSSGWKNLNKVLYLHLEDNDIPDFNNLSGLTHFKQIYFDQLKITDLKGLRNVIEFTTLVLDDNAHLTSIDFFDSLQRFDDLYARNTNIENVDSMTNVTEFRTLALSGSKLKNVNGLQNVRHFNEAYFNSTPIENVDGLSSVTTLDYLNLSNTTNLTSIQGLQNVSIINAKIDFDLKNFPAKLPATSPICGTKLLYKTFAGGTQIDPMSKYDTICERLKDDGNVQPGNTCETGFDGTFDTIDCSNMGLEKISSGWNSLSAVAGDLDLRNNSIVSIDNMSAITLLGSLLFDNSKITRFYLPSLSSIIGKIDFSNVNLTQAVKLSEILPTLTNVHRLKLGNSNITDIDIPNLSLSMKVITDNAACYANYMIHICRYGVEQYNQYNGNAEYSDWSVYDKWQTEAFKRVFSYSYLYNYIAFKYSKRGDYAFPLSSFVGVDTGSVYGFWGWYMIDDMQNRIVAEPGYLDIRGSSINDISFMNSIKVDELPFEYRYGMRFSDQPVPGSMIIMDDKEYQNKLPATTKFCSSNWSLHIRIDQDENKQDHFMSGTRAFNRKSDYGKICQDFTGDYEANNPQNDCFTGFSGEFGYILCNNFPSPNMQKLSAGWQNLTKVAYLDISNNESLTDASYLNNLSEIYELHAENNPNLKTIGVIGGTAHPYKIIVTGSGLTSLSFLQNITEAVDLKLNSLPNLSDISGLSNLQKVSTLDLSNNQSISSLSGLDNLKEVKELILSQDTKLSDIDALKNITKADSVYLPFIVFSKKMPKDVWLCNEGFQAIKDYPYGKDGICSEKDPDYDISSGEIHYYSFDQYYSNQSANIALSDDPANAEALNATVSNGSIVSIYEVLSEEDGYAPSCSVLDLTKTGTSDYVSLNRDVLNGAGDFTISAWIKIPSSNTHPMAILSGASQSSNNAVVFWIEKGNDGLSEIVPYINSSTTHMETGVRLNDGTWHMVTWTREGSKTCIYVDAVQKSCNSNFKDDTLSIAEGGLFIGQEQDSVGGSFDSNQAFDGYIDNIFIARRSLSSSEVEALFKGPQNGKDYKGMPVKCQEKANDMVTEALLNKFYDFHESYNRIGGHPRTVSQMLDEESKILSDSTKFIKTLYTPNIDYSSRKVPYGIIPEHPDYYYRTISGYIYFPRAGTYTFSAYTDDMAYLKIGNGDYWFRNTSAVTVTEMGSITVKSPMIVPFKAAVEDGYEGDGYVLYWSRDGSQATVIPSKNFLLSSSDYSDLPYADGSPIQSALGKDPNGWTIFAVKDFGISGSDDGAQKVTSEAIDPDSVDKRIVVIDDARWQKLVKNMTMGIAVVDNTGNGMFVPKSTLLSPPSRCKSIVETRSLLLPRNPSLADKVIWWNEPGCTMTGMDYTYISLYSGYDPIRDLSNVIQNWTYNNKEIYNSIPNPYRKFVFYIK